MEDGGKVGNKYATLAGNALSVVNSDDSLSRSLSRGECALSWIHRGQPIPSGGPPHAPTKPSPLPTHWRAPSSP